MKREVLNIVKYDNRPKEYVKIISGCARGADTLGERFAKEFGLEVKKFPADWDGLGKRAGYVRNAEMAKLNGRNFIGFEISKEYCDIAEERIKNII